MTDLRWVLSDAQVAGAFSEPIELPDGRSIFARLQYREMGMIDDAPWREIPVVSELREPPRVQIVRGSRH